MDDVCLFFCDQSEGAASAAAQALLLGIGLDTLISLLGTTVAVVGVWIALRRLWRTEVQARARVLTDLTRAWDSDYLTPGKDIFYPTGEAALAEFEARPDRTVTYEAFLEHKRRAFAEDIRALEARRRTALYVPLLRVADFFQNVAVMVDRGYVAERDALELFGYHLRLFDAVCGGYIRDGIAEKRKVLPTFASGLRYEAYVRLADKAHRRTMRLSERTAIRRPDPRDPREDVPWYAKQPGVPSRT